jgi:nitrate reductase gamma subunit
MKAVGTVLVIFAYICYAVFVLRVIWRIVLILKIRENRSPVPQYRSSPGGTTFITMLKMGRDIVLLTRLFRVNPLLWIGEWTFHAAFFLILMRHLRFVVDNPSGALMNLEVAGGIAGYLLPAALIYVLIIKLVVERKKYFSTGNFVLLFLLLLLGITGVVMKNFIHPDIVDIKNFISHALAFKFRQAPESRLFMVHFVAAFIFLAYIPAHVFAAPLSIMEARKQEDGLDKIIHDG